MQLSARFIRNLILVLIILALIGGGVWFYFSARGEKSITVKSPNGGEKLIAGKTYQITWKARGMGEVGIALIKGGQDVKWIAQDVSARKGEYEWEVFAWQESDEDYRISISEFPWQEGNTIDYSDNDFTILGPRFASCDELSIEAEWPYVPSDYPDLRRVFISNGLWTGDLGGLAGADEKCQKEAQEKGLEGTWKAFLGDDRELAVNRLNLDDIFIEAESIDTLPYEEVPPRLWKYFGKFLNKLRASDREKDAYKILKDRFSAFLKDLAGKDKQQTCHRLLGKNKDEFLARFSAPASVNQKILRNEFLNDFKLVWLGKINEGSKRECAEIFTDFPDRDIRKNYSFTTTCQNWSSGVHQLSGQGPFPKCYTPGGVLIDALALSGLSSGITKDGSSFSPSLAKTCDTTQRLICIKQ